MNKKPDEGLVFDTAGDEPPPPKARWPLSAVERSAYRSLAIMAVLFAVLAQ